MKKNKLVNVDLYNALLLCVSQFQDHVQYAEDENDGDLIAIKQAKLVLSKYENHN